MPRNKLHDAALGGDAALVLRLVEESRQRRLKQAQAAEKEARMVAIEAEAGGGRRALARVDAPPSPSEDIVHSSRRGVLEPRRQDNTEPTSFIEANAADALGRTPLHIAAAQGSIQVVDALLQANCNHRLADKRGRTALMEAASYGHASIVEELLHVGLTPAAQIKYAMKCDCAGWTALHDAAYRGHVGVVKVLLGPPVDPVWGTASGLALLGCSTAADGATASGNNAGRLMTPRQLAEQYSQADVLVAIDSWFMELERRREDMALQRRAETVAAHQRLALAASMHKMIASKLHHRRLYLPAAWRPSDLLLQAIAGYMPEQASDGPANSVVQRFLREGFVWRSMQERRVQRVALYVAKDLEKDTSCKPRWKQDDPFNATVHPVFSRSATNLPPGTDSEWDAQLMRKAEAETAGVERDRQQRLALEALVEERRRCQESETIENQVVTDQQQLAPPLAASVDDTDPVGLLSCTILTVVCICERVSSRLTSQTAGGLPYCEITLKLGAAGSEHMVVSGRTGRAKLVRPCNSNDVGAHAQLSWGEEARVEQDFHISAAAFEKSSRRSVHLDFVDLGVVEVDLTSAPTTEKRWKLCHWLELADEDGRHVATACIQVRWTPALCYKNLRRIESRQPG